MTTRRYHVKEDHIRQGVAGDWCACPVAHAVEDGVTDDEWVVSVGMFGGMTRILFEMDDLPTGRFLIGLPAPVSVSRFIEHFDRRHPVEPFSFELPDLGRIL